MKSRIFGAEDKLGCALPKKTPTSEFIGAVISEIPFSAPGACEKIRVSPSGANPGPEGTLFTAPVAENVKISDEFS